MKQGKTVVTARQTALMGVMTALLLAAVHVMAVLPNVEPVTLLVILYTLFLGKKVFYVLAAYLLLEGCWYGFGQWWFSYAYIWPLLAFLTYLFRKRESVLFFSIFSGLFGLFFGALCSLSWLVIGGWGAAFAWWVAGIPFDLIHCISNTALCMVLFRPLHYVFRKTVRDF